MSKLPPYKKPTNLNALIQQICLRPAMFVGFYDFYRVCAFIDGFIFAASDLQPEKYSMSELKEFGGWLAEKFNYPRNYGWGMVREVFPDDETAFVQLPLLYEQFLNQPNKTSSTDAK